jgi:UDP-N-acetylglucosamine 2-epimerase (non-hydrolysing)/GDP/UDP-N,N'-diacetylbacillosamine 2-epimerase (hydrolysing)
MGEEPWRVHTVGFTAIDLIQEKSYATPEEIKKLLRIDISKPIVLFTQHSISQTPELSTTEVAQSLKALRKLSEEGIQVIITYPNNDAGSIGIIDLLHKLGEENLQNIVIKKSLGRYYYHGILALALEQDFHVACVGNSSSGIKETPAFKCPTVNIGSRQEGRLRGQNVIDVDYVAEDIYSAISKCLFNAEFRQECRNGINPYWKGGAGIKIANYLSTLQLDDRLIRKKMTLKGDLIESFRSDL